MLKIAIVGATGIVGQQAIVSLLGHPWFKITKLVASERSAEKKYIDALRDANGSIRWWCTEELPADIANMVVEEAASFDPTSVDIIFSTMDAGPAKELEPKYAKTTPVISTASAFRYEDDTPILVGGVNMDHAALLAVQQKNRGWKGFISPKSNCTIAGLVVSLKPILDAFGVKQVMMTSLAGHVRRGPNPGTFRHGYDGKCCSLYSGRRAESGNGTAEDFGEIYRQQHSRREVRHYRHLHPRAGD